MFGGIYLQRYQRLCGASVMKRVDAFILDIVNGTAIWDFVFCYSLVFCNQAHCFSCITGRIILQFTFTHFTFLIVYFFLCILLFTFCVLDCHFAFWGRVQWGASFVFDYREGARGWGIRAGGTWGDLGEGEGWTKASSAIQMRQTHPPPAAGPEGRGTQNRFHKKWCSLNFGL